MQKKKRIQLNVRSRTNPQEKEGRKKDKTDRHTRLRFVAGSLEMPETEEREGEGEAMAPEGKHRDFERQILLRL